MTRSATVSDIVKIARHEKSSCHMAGRLEAFGVKLSRAIDVGYQHQYLEYLYG